MLNPLCDQVQQRMSTHDLRSTKQSRQKQRLNLISNFFFRTKGTYRMDFMPITDRVGYRVLLHWW